MKSENLISILFIYICILLSIKVYTFVRTSSDIYRSILLCSITSIIYNLLLFFSFFSLLSFRKIIMNQYFSLVFVITIMIILFLLYQIDDYRTKQYVSDLYIKHNFDQEYVDNPYFKLLLDYYILLKLKQNAKGNIGFFVGNNYIRQLCNFKKGSFQNVCCSEIENEYKSLDIENTIKEHNYFVSHESQKMFDFLESDTNTKEDKQKKIKDFQDKYSNFCSSQDSSRH